MACCHGDGIDRLVVGCDLVLLRARLHDRIFPLVQTTLSETLIQSFFGR
jgi:hypothetical protein